MTETAIALNPLSSPLEESEADDIYAWCNLFGVSENELYLMTEREIHKRLDQCEYRKSLKAKQQSDYKNSPYNHLNLRNFKIGQSYIKPVETTEDENSVISIPDVEFLQHEPESPQDLEDSFEEDDRERGGQNCPPEEEDSSYLFQVLCEVANKLESSFGSDVFSKTGIVPCISKNSITEFNISSCGCKGDSFNTHVFFDYDNNLVLFESKKVTCNDEVITSKEIPLHKNPYECMFDSFLCGNADDDDDGVVEIISYNSNPLGDKKTTLVSYDGNTTEDTHTTMREIEESEAECEEEDDEGDECGEDEEEDDEGEECGEDDLENTVTDFGNRIYTHGQQNLDLMDDAYGSCEMSPVQYDVEDCATPMQFDPMVRGRRGVFENLDYEDSPAVYYDEHNSPGKQIPYYNAQEEMLQQRMQPQRSSPVSRRDTGAFDLAKLQPRRLQLDDASCSSKFQKLKGLFKWGR